MALATGGQSCLGAKKGVWKYAWARGGRVRVADALCSGRGALTSSPSSPFSTPAKPAGTPHLCAPAGYKPITENVLDANKLSR